MGVYECIQLASLKKIPSCTTFYETGVFFQSRIAEFYNPGFDLCEGLRPLKMSRRLDGSLRLRLHFCFCTLGFKRPKPSDSISSFMFSHQFVDVQTFTRDSPLPLKPFAFGLLPICLA